MRLSLLVFIALFCMFVNPLVHAAKVTSGKDPQARLPYWQVEDKGMSLRLVQRLPDLFRGFFLGRGFDERSTEIIAHNCGFQTVFKNISHKHKPSAIRYDLNKWVIYYQGKRKKLKTREWWQRQWKDRKVPKTAMLALKWALFPTVQEYKPGDYNWGMTMFGLKPGSRFDLEVYWQQHGKAHRLLIKNMQCGPDTHPNPEKFLTP